MEKSQTSVEELFYKLKDYGDTRLDLLKLKSINKTAGFLSTVITSLVVFMLFFLVIIFVSIGLALLIGQWLSNYYYGFFIIAAIYLIAGLVLYANKTKLIKTPVSDYLIKDLMD
ncbi:MAG: hypothetical protein JSS98_03900 [Bacteroidetes bacterium]|nr:hypothetical protein [Bacteroidota bacterium]